MVPGLNSHFTRCSLLWFSKRSLFSYRFVPRLCRPLSQLSRQTLTFHGRVSCTNSYMCTSTGKSAGSNPKNYKDVISEQVRRRPTPKRVLQKIFIKKYLKVDDITAAEEISAADCAIPINAVDKLLNSAVQHIPMSKAGVVSALVSIASEHNLDKVSLSLLRYLSKESDYLNIPLTTAGCLLHLSYSASQTEEDQEMVQNLLNYCLTFEPDNAVAMLSLTVSLVDTPVWEVAVPKFLDFLNTNPKSGDLTSQIVKIASLLLERSLLQQKYELAKKIYLKMTSMYTQMMETSPYHPAEVIKLTDLVLRYAVDQPSLETSRNMFEFTLEGLVLGKLLLGHKGAKLVSEVGPVCPHCTREYRHCTMKPSELSNLQKTIKQQMVGTNVYNRSTPDEVAQFFHQVEQFGRDGPVDYVVDGLNVAGWDMVTRNVPVNKAAYRVFGKDKLRDVIDYLCVKQKKRVFLVGTTLLRSLLSTDHQLLDNLRTYIIGQRSSDDLFMLYAALSFPGAKLFSRDAFKNHVNKMGKLAKYNFRLWQKAYQVSLTGIQPDGTPVLQPNQPWAWEPYRTPSGWHLPLAMSTPEESMLLSNAEHLNNVIDLYGVVNSSWVCLKTKTSS